MSEQMFVNDPIKFMREENKRANLFNGVAVMRDDEGDDVVVYHEACDEDLMVLPADIDFSDLLDKVLEHLGECVPDEDDDNDPWEDLLSDEDEED